ncbi:hypothetical protein EDB92DRAFT_1819365 [Lactarius akahatsu]|uniref:Uncharacterized protein n=1 Tax=Lactarius akahatsu TaxID=416441 RepID=A0AAD4Q751_9AGAM|nr:hypothetical protein EDB92DRAFT_1819365 [Lactarius akahatsu]
MPACTPFPVNGEGWGRGSRAPFLHVWGGVAKGREVPGAVYLHATPFCANGEGWSWGWRALREGEEGGSGSEGDVERWGDVPSCAPLPHEWGREERWPASCAPFHTYGALWTREKGWGGGQHGEGCMDKVEGVGPMWSAPMCPPSAQMGKGGGQRALVPPFPHEYGGTARGKGWDQRRHALVCTLLCKCGGADGGEGRAQEAKGFTI